MKDHDRETMFISGFEDGARLESRILEERIQRAVRQGYSKIEVDAMGQHGIGGRLWFTPGRRVKVDVYGQAGQRLGAMGSPYTAIEMHGPASDDVGWLNAGSKIIVHGDATNGVANAMAQGRIYIAGNIGARGMTMTKHNPRFDPPELWVLGGAGDSFAEFMAGGTAVICGLGQGSRSGSILGYRPCVGMVGGRIFFRGTQKEFSDKDAKLVNIEDEEWSWLEEHLGEFLKAIGRQNLAQELTQDRSAWRLIMARHPSEKAFGKGLPMARFKSEVWDRELGEGGLIGDIETIDRSLIGVVERGDLRRYIPVWNNGAYMSPCQAACPTGIPVGERWSHIRKGDVRKAVDLALKYTPFPATVCGYLCPNLCMEGCTRSLRGLKPIDTSLLGKASLEAGEPEPSTSTGVKIAVIGGGPAGLSVAWQLWMKGHEPVVFDREGSLGGKIRDVIPFSRIPSEVFEHELSRVKKRITIERLKGELDKRLFMDIVDRHDYTVIAVGASRPRTLKINGAKRAISALDFLKAAKRNKLSVGAKVVIIGAGNVGCDVAAEAYRLGAKEVSLVDIQKPASFGRERLAAQALGAGFVWPVGTKEITDEGVVLTDGRMLEADTVVVSIGDAPDLGFLPDGIETKDGYIKVDERYLTSNDKVYAIGDSVRPGLITDAIGAGRAAALDIDSRLKGAIETMDRLQIIDVSKVKLEYYDPRAGSLDDLETCAETCASCGLCRDCGLCEAICPERAISRMASQDSGYEYVADASRCTGCGFCAGACPCGIWEMHENDLPL